MERVRTFARRAAQVNVPVLILGETGTGKSLLGKVIHRESPRALGPFLAINCAGIPDSLFESEFFGHQRGAFTGAREGRKGLLEQAQGGSLFLDEVGELTVPQQAKLLMALEEGEVRRLGGEGTVRVDVRVLAATSLNLAQEMREGGFRRELYHRLAVLTCLIPPLRARREDVSVLTRRLLRKHQQRHGCPPAPLSAEALRYLGAQSWPGNVRELSHLLEAALILSEGGVLEVEALRAADAMAGGGKAAGRDRSGGGDIDGGADPPTTGGPEPERAQETGRYAFRGNEDEEREEIRSALTRVRGNKSRAARELGMARNTLRQRIRKYGLG
jgi:DNA-binding NtrC family response regulator